MFLTLILHHIFIDTPLVHILLLLLLLHLHDNPLRHAHEITYLLGLEDFLVPALQLYHLLSAHA
jgi:hypothetical protein